MKVKGKIEKLHKDVNDIFWNFEKGKIDIVTANKHLESLCRWFLEH